MYLREFNLKDVKNVLITGASKGLGLEIAKLAASQPGYRILAISRDTRSLKTLSINENSELLTWNLDLGVEDSVGQFISEIKHRNWQFDGMILNAGIFKKSDINSVSWMELDILFRVNCFAPFSLCSGLSSNMDKGAHVILVSSMGGFQGSREFPGNTGYCMSKGALSIMGECMAAELQEKGIRVNVVCPGAVKTQMLKEAFPDFQGGVDAKAMAEWLWNYYKEGRDLFNGVILPVTSGVI
jgi:3-oxoacyl-[acyl-carrier protein] reductase